MFILKKFLLLFLTMCSFSQELPLKKMYNFFECVKGNHQEHDLVKAMSRYQHVLFQSVDAIKNNANVGDHVWYRAEIAKVIFAVGFDVFKNNIEPYLYDWHLYGTQALVKVNNVTPQYFQDLSMQWSGTTGFFWRSGRCYDHKVLNGVLQTDGRPYTLFGNGDDAKKYYSLLQARDNCYLILSTVKERLLRSPQTGILFCHGFYYGLIDYEKKNAIVYDRSNEDVKTINFSNSIPWGVLKTYGTGKASLFFNQDMICLTFFDSFVDKKPEGQIVYQIRKPSDPIDLSLAESYQSFNGPIRFVDQSSAFAKYSHAWFSFYFYKFLIKDPIKKSFKAKSWFGAIKPLWPFVVFFISTLSLLAFGMVGSIYVIQKPSSLTFKAEVFASNFLGLLMSSLYFRGFHL